MPFAIKSAIEQELDRLEASGAIKKVTCSDWAAPIVPVPKKDGKFRICGDYKVTINQALEVDQYPLPKPEDLFATLAGGNKFSKLDLSQAYQQFALDEQSTTYVTINTHKGLYRYKRLPFGVASAPALFQKLMDTVLQGIPHVICYIDDILVTGVNDGEHLSTLATVLQRLQQYGFRMKQTKCEFLKPSVEYLGHLIDDEGLHAMPTQTLSGILELLLSSLDQSLTWSRLNKVCIGSDTLITCVHTVKPHPELSHLHSRNLHPWLRLKTLMSLCQFNQTRNKHQMLNLLHLMNIRIHVIRVGIGDHLRDLCDQS